MKKWRARIPHPPRQPVGVDPVRIAILGAGKLLPEERTTVDGLFTAAIDGVVVGDADAIKHWRTLADFLNIAEALADLGICSDPDSRGRISSAQDALLALAQGRERTGSWAPSDADLAALREGAWLHSTQLVFCSRSEYERAERTVRNRTRAALAGNTAHGVDVVEVTR